MHGNQVLAHHGHRCDACEHAPLHPEDGFLPGALTVEPADEGIGEQLRQSGVGDSHSEGPEQRVGQSDACTAGQAFLEGDHRRLQADPGEQATHQCSQEQRQHDVYSEGGENQHHENGGDNGIHGRTPQTATIGA